MAWDIGLEPLAFTVTLSMAIGEVKDELGDGVTYSMPP
jgi:hypothetical protein